MQNEIAKAKGGRALCQRENDTRTAFLRYAKKIISPAVSRPTAGGASFRASTVVKSGRRDRKREVVGERSKVRLNKMSGGVWQAKEINQAPLCAREARYT